MHSHSAPFTNSEKRTVNIQAQKFSKHNYTKSSPEHDFIEATHRLERSRVYVYVDIWVREGAALRERERERD